MTIFVNYVVNFLASIVLVGNEYHINNYMSRNWLLWMSYCQSIDWEDRCREIKEKMQRSQGFCESIKEVIILHLLIGPEFIIIKMSINNLFEY